MKIHDIVIMCFVFAFTSCAITPSKIVGEYKSLCSLYDKPSLKMKLNGNNTFEYEFAYLEEPVTGTWTLDGNSLILKSKYFSDEFVEAEFPGTPKELTPAYKFTEVEGKDVYILKRRKLIIMEKEGAKKKCHLLKIK